MGLGEHRQGDNSKEAEAECLKPINNKDREDNGLKNKDTESAAVTHKQGICQKFKVYSIAAIIVITGLTLIPLFVIIARHQRESPSTTQENNTCVQCEDGWITYKGKCYYLSDGLDTWKNSQEFCKEHDSSLAFIDNKEDYNFLNHVKGNRWIGLSRTEDNSGWVWTNGKLYSENLFHIERLPTQPGQSEHAFQNHDGIKSKNGNVVTKWICSKKLHLKPS